MHKGKKADINGVDAHEQDRVGDRNLATKIELLGC